MNILRKFEAAQYLDDEVTMAEYLSACLEDSNPDVFLTALGDVAKARGMIKLAQDRIEQGKPVQDIFNQKQTKIRNAAENH